MRELIRRVFFLLILLVLLSLHYSQGFEIGYQIEPFEEGPVFDCFREKSPEGKRQKETDEILQFVAGGHILGFRKHDVFIASGDHALRIEFLNARPISPANERTSPDTENNRQLAKPLGRVIYSDLWDGVTLVYERHSTGVVKSTYTVQPAGTDASNPVDRIRLCYNVPVGVDNGGNLVFSFETGQMKESRPVAWQEIEGKHIPVEVSFCSLSEWEVGFKVGSYDPQFPLVIDPVISWNTFMGSADNNDVGYAIAVDKSGNVYVAGDSYLTWGTPVNAHAGSADAFAAKLNSSGILQWNTFMGSASADYGHAIAVDTSGNVYVAGDSYLTWGTPVNAHAGGSTDAFAAKLNSSGVLQWNTFMGSADWDVGYAIAVDTSGNVYVAGCSYATWGTPINPYAGGYDAFAAKLDSSGVRQWHTFMGSASMDYGHAIAVDTSGNVYVAGYSRATWGTPINPYAGSDDAFAVKIADITKDDLIGTWDGQGVYYRDSDTGTWVKMASPADLIVAGDLDGDGTDDLIGIWAGQGGVWVKYSSTGSWSKLSTTARDIASGDMNGDGTDDLLGTWDGQGVYYRDSDTGTWVKMASPADLIATGDLDGDGTDDLLGTWDGQGVYYRDSDTGTWVKMASPADLIVAGDLDGDGTDDLCGIWAGQGGVWVKYSSTGSWSKLSSTARDIDAGNMSGGAGGGGLAGFIKLLAPIGGYAEGPENLVEYVDLSSKGPGGWNFGFQVEKNLFPQEKESTRIMLIPGPGELGFRCIEHKNLVPQEDLERKIRKRK